MNTLYQGDNRRIAYPSAVVGVGERSRPLFQSLARNGTSDRSLCSYPSAFLLSAVSFTTVVGDEDPEEEDDGDDDESSVGNVDEPRRDYSKTRE
ncbi:MAG: hypothetical protein ABJA02_11750 [Acidobacteriota bacterium]